MIKRLVAALAILLLTSAVLLAGGALLDSRLHELEGLAADIRSAAGQNDRQRAVERFKTRLADSERLLTAFISRDLFDEAMSAASALAAYCKSDSLPDLLAELARTESRLAIMRRSAERAL